MNGAFSVMSSKKIRQGHHPENQLLKSKGAKSDQLKECVDFLKKEENGKKNQLVFHQLRTFQKKVNKTMRRLILERATCKKMLLNALLFSHSNTSKTT
jgi:hypothetical protein